jgi:hypothetical protein
MTRLDTLIEIKEGLELILGVNGGNYLGVYEVVKNGIVIANIPSIKIRYPMQVDTVNTRMKRNSGVECVIDSEPQMVSKPSRFGLKLLNYHQIIIDQHKELGDISSTVQSIIESNYFDIPESPIIRGAYISESGVIPPRALIFIRKVIFSPFTIG